MNRGGSGQKTVGEGGGGKGKVEKGKRFHRSRANRHRPTVKAAVVDVGDVGGKKPWLFGQIYAQGESTA